MSELHAAASRLRAAIAEGEFGPALALLPQFRRELDTAMAGVPAGSEAAQRIAEDARGLLEWARRATLCGHAQMAAQLETLACADAYAGARPERHRWNLEG